MTAKQRVFATVYGGALLIFLAGVILQVLWRVDALLPTLILWGFSRIGLSLWQWIQPDVAIGSNRSPSRLLFTIAAWTLIVGLLITGGISK